MPLFFLPFAKVTEWAGLPKGIAMYQWLASELKLESMLQMDEKTGRKAIKSREKTSKRTQKEFAEFEAAIAAKLGNTWPPVEFPEEVGGTSLRWHEWDRFARHEDANLPRHFLPATRKFIHNLAMAERDVARSIAAASDLLSAIVALVDNPLARMLCPEVDPVKLLHGLGRPTNESDLARFSAANSFFKQWILHCMVSLLMDILASADLEFCREHLPQESAPRDELVQKSMVLRILPRIANGTLIRPVPALLECWCESESSYRRMASNIRGPKNLKDREKMLRLWRQGRHIPDKQSAKGFLNNLIPEDENHRQVEFLRYHIALLLHQLYKAVERALPEACEEDRVRLFQTFAEHRVKHVSGRESIPPPGI